MSSIAHINNIIICEFVFCISLTKFVQLDLTTYSYLYLLFLKQNACFTMEANLDFNLSCGMAV